MSPESACVTVDGTSRSEGGPWGGKAEENLVLGAPRTTRAVIPPLITAATALPHSSVGKESACNAGDPGLIPGSGRYTEEGIGYPLQYSWTFLAAQPVKNLPTMHKM